MLRCETCKGEKVVERHEFNQLTQAWEHFKEPCDTCDATGKVDFHTDFRGNTIDVGDTIVYAALSGRSCQLIEGEVLAIELREKGSYYNKDGILKFKVQPTQRYSRWEQHWTGRGGQVPKPVWIRAEMAMRVDARV